VEYVDLSKNNVKYQSSKSNRNHPGIMEYGRMGHSLKMKILFSQPNIPMFDYSIAINMTFELKGV